ncbi:MAG: hypothetical protein HN729_03120 [Candidatus Marinimicrobia bacterium]|jgi:hypothetical protein|nr:hypothetical protein [Candidatus Neomarinimicrobiota bacterium]MBT3632975.1 hypothetical protein [Candidatus Neomarinimicrobiota bacterium]MBT3682085.1 hypothetical protein [Candidatus Neomarinimicrobiota bacterium]MBT3758886.1 hypothetical protein [Candidatus Neomarinimicrobiota bacterium]MBT3895215.1 hypothetical protein [Candidatus Neomarinimicrobiota bacterium]
MYSDQGLVYIQAGILWTETMNCSDWFNLGEDGYPVIIDDSEDENFVDWFGPPYPKNVILNKDMEIIHISFGRHYPAIESGILLGMSQLSINEDMEPDFYFNSDIQPFDYSDTNQTNPLINFDDNGQMHLVWFQGEENFANIYYSRSDDFGETFSDPVMINSIEGSVLNALEDQPVLKTNNEKIIILWTDTRLSSNAIFISESFDGGLTFVENREVSNPQLSSRFPEFEIAPDGIYHLLYYVFENDEIAGTRYAWSNDSSSSFNPDIEMDLTGGYGTPCPTGAPDMEFSNDGDIFIAFRNFIYNESDPFVSKIFHGSTEVYWTGPLYWSEWSTDVCPPSRPVLELNYNRIASAFSIFDPEQTYILFGVQDDSWFELPSPVDPVQISQWQGSPSIVFDEEYLHSVWVESTQSNQNIYYGFGKTYEQGIFNRQQVNDNTVQSNTFAQNPYIDIYQGELFCVWSEMDNGIFQIFFSRTIQNIPSYGDINQDDQVNILDIIFLMNFILGEQEYSDEQLQLADLNQDAEINILDVINLINLILDPSID